MVQTLPAAGAASAGPVSTEQAIYAWLTGVEHFTAPQAAGILANAKVESGFDTGAYNPGEGAIGLFQWEGGRRTALDAYAASIGQAETSLTAQLGYLGRELAGPYASVVAAIRGTSDPATAARLWDIGPGGVNSGTGFENSSGAADLTRQQDAQSIYAQIVAGQSLTGGPTAGAVTTDAYGIKIGPWTIPGTGSIPGNVLPSIPGAGAVTSAIEQPVKDLVSYFTKPFVHWLTDVFLIIVGAVFVVLAVKMLGNVDQADTAAGGGSSTAPAGGGSSSTSTTAGGSSSSGGSSTGRSGSATAGMAAMAKRGVRDVEAAAAE